MVCNCMFCMYATLMGANDETSFTLIRVLCKNQFGAWSSIKTIYEYVGNPSPQNIWTCIKPACHKVFGPNGAQSHAFWCGLSQWTQQFFGMLHCTCISAVLLYIAKLHHNAPSKSNIQSARLVLNHQKLSQNYVSNMIMNEKWLKHTLLRCEGVMSMSRIHDTFNGLLQ